MKQKSKFDSYLKYHHYGGLLIFCSLGILFDGLAFFICYSNVSTDILSDYQNKYQVCIYLTMFYYNDDANMFLDENTHIFQSKDADFINTSNKIVFYIFLI